MMKQETRPESGMMKPAVRTESFMTKPGRSESFQARLLHLEPHNQTSRGGLKVRKPAKRLWSSSRTLGCVLQLPRRNAEKISVMPGSCFRTPVNYVGSLARPTVSHGGAFYVLQLPHVARKNTRQLARAARENVRRKAEQLL